MVGAGITGDLIGGIVPSSSITTPTYLTAERSSTGPMCIGDERLWLAMATQEAHEPQAAAGSLAPTPLSVTLNMVHLREPSAQAITLLWRGTALSVATPVSAASTVAVASTVPVGSTAVVVGDSAPADLSDEATTMNWISSSVGPAVEQFAGVIRLDL